MKRALAIVFTVFYFTAASGMTVHFHYCMGQLVNWGLSHEKGDRCSNCGMDKAKAKKCCADKHQQVKIDKAQKGNQNNFQFKQISLVAVSNHPSDLLLVLPVSLVEEKPQSNAPPRIGKAPVFILNCTYRI
jgi:hypothetical protein